MYIYFCDTKCVNLVHWIMPSNNSLSIDGTISIEDLLGQIQSLRSILTHLNQLPSSALVNIQKRYINLLIRRAQTKILELRRDH